ncbi:hypothetical protein HYH03_013406 [Edaphochlamys debaryana]|uniref:Uncharacterized protein n=1 Tax=Edaphochlamys debaryana TaxID=47281 RepID=A0A835XQ21_9CHLO|nr:hypothetical protein HYH03_013406 [Edaphochlamys debaryana]|eukprot:KAG2487966.1 hypothetical protein HYH03_013406 [Edaphochlamys debaryana]
MLLVRAARGRAAAFCGAAVALGIITIPGEDGPSTGSVTRPVSAPWLPTCSALADSATPPRPAQPSAGPRAGRPPSSGQPVVVSLSGFEGVKDTHGFVAAALAAALRRHPDSHLSQLLRSAAASGSPSSVEPEAFYALVDRQASLSEKVLLLDELVDCVVGGAEKAAEVSGLTLGLLGGGALCYALAGWVVDVALPGVGTVGCGAVAGAAGHLRAQASARRARDRFLEALLSAAAASAAADRPNPFLSFLASPSLAGKQAVAASTPAAAFCGAFYAAVRPLLRRGAEDADAAGRAVLVAVD